MKFSLGDTGADSINGGIGSIFKALAQAPLIQQQAEQQAALHSAQTYSANMSGNKHGAEAESERYTLGRRQKVPELIAADPAMPAYMQAAYKLFDLTGDTNAHRVAQAGSEVQTQGIRDQAVANVSDLDKMNRYNTLAKPGDTYTPFDNVGTTGHVFNKATGAGLVSDAILSKLFGNKVNSEIAENNAQAGNANASADQHRASTDLIRTKISPTGGKPLTPAQLRENADIDAAREQLAGMNEADVNAALGKDAFSMTPGDKQLVALIARARRAKFGETDVPTTTPKPALPVVPQQGVIAKLFNYLTTPDPRPGAPAKDAAPAAAAPTMNDNMQQAAEAVRAAYKAGKITRDEAKKQLQAMGFN